MNNNLYTVNNNGIYKHFGEYLVPTTREQSQKSFQLRML